MYKEMTRRTPNTNDKWTGVNREEAGGPIQMSRYRKNSYAGDKVPDSRSEGELSISLGKWMENITEQQK